mmetsp:Transcript_18015/g.45040  ORF Transcript_18015/g.45040 Transcript_18015/m.45040 type:complete len:223 (-) Transcript_18015:3129-3797(-)
MGARSRKRASVYGCRKRRRVWRRRRCRILTKTKGKKRTDRSDIRSTSPLARHGATAGSRPNAHTMARDASEMQSLAVAGLFSRQRQSPRWTPFAHRPTDGPFPIPRPRFRTDTLTRTRVSTTPTTRRIVNQKYRSKIFGRRRTHRIVPFRRPAPLKMCKDRRSSFIFALPMTTGLRRCTSGGRSWRSSKRPNALRTRTTIRCLSRFTTRTWTATASCRATLN